MTVLVVDDEVAICEGTVRRLRRIVAPDTVVLSAFSAEEALELLKRRRVEILITDIYMDSLSGLALIEQGKLLQAGPMSCIIITAYELFQYAHKAIQLGVNDFLVKPYSEAALRDAVGKAISQLESHYATERMYLEKMLENPSAANRREIAECLAGMGYPPAPDVVRVVATEEVVELAQGWEGEWRFCNPAGKYAILSDEPEKLARMTAQLNVCAGISLAGALDGERFTQARRALRFALLRECPNAVFYAPEMENEQLLKQNNAVLWALQYAHEHAGEPMTLSMICGLLHVNYSYFSRLFHHQTGKTFSRYVQEVQMRWAAEALRHGARVCDLSDRIGYCNADSFAKSFARVYGCSPRKWLAEHQKNGADMEDDE